MKKILKKIIEIQEKDLEDQQSKNFLLENEYLISSFSNKIKELNILPEDFSISVHDSYIKCYSEKHTTFSINSFLYRKKSEGVYPTEIGYANLIIILNNHSENFKTLKKKEYQIMDIYLTQDSIGVIYIGKNNKLDFFVEENSIELITIKSVDLYYEEFKYLLK